MAPDAWLFGATLLGPIREGKIIAWDRDVDLGYPSEKVDEAFIQTFRDAGFQVFGAYKYSHPGMEKYLFPGHTEQYGKFMLRKEGVKIEICCFTRGIDGRHYYASGTPRFFVLEHDLIYPQHKVRFADFEANVPVNAEAQLAFVYGDDWRTPKREWYFTPDHYLRREHTIIEFDGDDGTRWSKWTGRKVIEKHHGPQKFPADINTPHHL